MKGEDLKQVTEFAGEAREILLGMLAPMLNERLTGQPLEAYAVYLANIRWAAYNAIEALSRLERMSEAAGPLWSESYRMPSGDEPNEKSNGVTE